MAEYSKIIFVNADGDYEETTTADTLKLASFKTATYELTDTLLGQLTNDVILKDGSRAFTGSIAGIAATASNHLVTKAQLDQIASQQAALEFQNSVIDKDITTPPGSPSTGDRYLIGLDPGTPTASGAWAGNDGQIAEWNGSSWDFTAGTTGMLLSADDESSALYYFNGTLWVIREFEATTASLGVEKVGKDLRLDLLAGGGLKLTGNEVGLEPADIAGEGLVDDGSDNLAIDWSTAFNDSKAVKASDLNSNGANQGAKIIGVDPASIPQSSATDLQTLLNDLANAVTEFGVEYTAGSGGVTKGDLVYVDANNSAIPQPISGVGSGKYTIGVALNTATAGQTVKVAANDVLVTGALTGATAGERIWWDGSAPTTTKPSGSGEMLILMGVAKNATDLHVEVKRIRRNG